MGLVAEYSIHCDALPLVGVADDIPEARLQIDLQFNHDRRPLFILTVTGCPRAAIESTVDETAEVSDWTFIGEAGDTCRFQLVPALALKEQLGDEIDDLSQLRDLAMADAIIERTDVQRRGWRQRGWFANRTAFSNVSSFWNGHSEFHLHQLTRTDEPAPSGHGLTDRQHEALRIAYEMGYFEIPRTASLDDIAAELDITAPSVSERLRRAQTRLIEETFATTWPELPD